VFFDLNFFDLTVENVDLFKVDVFSKSRKYSDFKFSALTA
jgi:hypothetical protein